MPRDSLQDLIRVVPPPSVPDPIKGVTTTDTLGDIVALPSDYLEFMRVYGPGSFATRFPFLDIYNLTDVSEQLSTSMQVAKEAHQNDPVCYPPPFPSISGLLPWGSYDQGYEFYWIVDGPSDRWRIFADLRGTHPVFEMTMTEFLAHILCPSLPDYLGLIPENRGVGYCPASKRSECFSGRYVPERYDELC